MEAASTVGMPTREACERVPTPAAERRPGGPAGPRPSARSPKSFLPTADARLLSDDARRRGGGLVRDVPLRSMPEAGKPSGSERIFPDARCTAPW
jgi:hypothetical protein